MPIFGKGDENPLSVPASLCKLCPRALDISRLLIVISNKSVQVFVDFRRVGLSLG